MLECKVYTTKEFKELTQVKDRQWRYEKEEFLEYCNNFFEFTHYQQGRAHFYSITNIFEDWKPYPGKKNAEVIQEYYMKETYEIIKKQPRNTGSNVARILIAEDKNVYNHKDNTMCRYIRPCIRAQFISDPQERAWCELIKEDNVYRELTEEELNYLYNECFEKAAFTKKEMLDIVGDMRAGTITSEEAGIAMENYLSGPFESCIVKFKSKFGFRPIRVPLWRDENDCAFTVELK